MTRMEPEEMQEFSKQMKEAGEGGESLTHISLAISILAVLVAMVTVIGHRSHTEAVLMQARASDQWAEYQAKRIRASQLAGAADILTLASPTKSDAVEEKLKQYAEQQKKYTEDTAEESNKAKELEGEVTHAERQAFRYDVGEALLQISVVLCSVTLFTRRKLYFFAGVGIGIIGLLFAATGFLITQ